MRFCEYCGAQRSEKAKFCPSCGKIVEVPAEVLAEVPAELTAEAELTCAEIPQATEIHEERCQKPNELETKRIGQRPQLVPKKIAIVLTAVLSVVLFLVGAYYLTNSAKNEEPGKSEPVATTKQSMQNSNPISQGDASPATKSIPDFASKIGDRVQQVILVKGSQGIVSAQLELWEKSSGVWTKKNTYTAVVGKNGLATENQKSEGDSKTPQGVFELGPAFGYAGYQNTKMEYRQLTDEDYWVDDAESNRYNTWVKGRPGNGSYEKLKRSDQLHELGIVIRYNMNPVVSGKGSAIFIHVWRDSNSGTAGGVAVSLGTLRDIFQWVNPLKHPHIIIKA